MNALADMYGLVLMRQEFIFWGLVIIVLVILIADILRNMNSMKSTNRILFKLGRLRRPNIGYELVLKAMKLSTWTIQARTHVVVYESDYREGINNFIPSPNADIYKIAEYIIPDDRERVVKSLNDICSGAVDTYHELYRVRMPSSDNFYWEESFATVASRDSQQMPISVVGTSMRIDERKKMEEALVDAYNKAEEGNRLKSVFLANMSHEIRTPLNSIVGFSNILLSADSEEQRAECVKMIDNSTQTLLQLMDDIFQLSASEAGSSSIVKTPIELNSMIMELYDKYAASNKKASVELRMSILPDAHVIETDRNILFQIMRNFIDNALKFTAYGYVEIGYKLLDGKGVRLYVKDTGKGIPQEQHEHVFERFVKLDNFVQGTGLGLSVCKSFAYNINAKIGLDSVVGKGSTFWIDVTNKSAV